MREMLFDIPKNKLKITVFKEKHGIETLFSKGCEPPWCALHMPTARKYGYGVTETSSFGDCVAKVCRLLDESGVMGYGETEAEAIVETCKSVGIIVLPSDL
jgi:hypothetical protein